MNNFLSSTYWNERYLHHNSGWDTGSVTLPLKTYFDQLEDKTITILIPGAGNAYEAEYLVSKGFTNVFVCDLAEEPLKNLKKRCPEFKPENLLHTDFFELSNHLPNTLRFDLIIEQTFFCALSPSLRPNYFKHMSTLLKPGGKLVGLLFNDALNKNEPPFGGNKEEYFNYIDDSFKIRTFETCYNSIAPRRGRELFINLELKIV